MIYLSIEEIISIHKELIKRTGGIEGLRDRALLESAVSSIFASFENYEHYPTIAEKAARLAFAIISNHAFLDGNKRIGIAVMLITLKLGKVNLIYTQEELISLGISIADGISTYKDILKWIKSHQ